MRKQPANEWHLLNGARAREINLNLRKLSASTQNRYGRRAEEAQLITEIAKQFFNWRCALEHRQYQEIQTHDQRSCWLGAPAEAEGENYEG